MTQHTGDVLTSIQTSDVFTPAKLPTITDVDREDLSKALDRLLRRGGFYIPVMGTTKLGKTTLVNSALKKMGYSIFLRGQSLSEGSETLWLKLAAELEIPASKDTGTVSGDKSTWGFFGKFAATLALVGKAEAGAQVGGEHSLQQSTSKTVPLDAESEVIKALELLAKGGLKVAIAIDDFHFITDVEKRRSIIRALRPVTGAGVSVVLITLPNRATDPAFQGTNIGGRQKSITVGTWDQTDLEKIATLGFAALNVVAKKSTIARLASESFGSPQIMQQLCLDLCEDVNDVLEKVEGDTPLTLQEPSNWNEFFKSIKDHDSADWLTTLGLGPKKKRDKRSKYEVGGRRADGYQLILLALRDLGVPTSVPFADIKAQIGKMLQFDAKQLNVMALEAKANNMHVLAHKVMDEKLGNFKALEAKAEDDDYFFDEEEVELAGDIPQPVFEFTKSATTPLLNVLDPWLAYTLKWHEDSFLG
ncbi:hypothetical protein QFZ36_004194 [Pseudarthrobacter siccitolerans]|uniref:Orc1-like AAA ATPase domain-containing protein n=1 Tax=Pseudarthrobacter siccitolerans TaxID=861266 RepID=A0ABU0PRH1_9MICC|nr:hypothetical protein [Pseudarthrobacter siccitolerans]MDQ0676568.1 hypothetical protein [Pseudarthrobacter siccitolerans]